MLEIDKLQDVIGNNVILYSISTLLEKNTFPKFTILSGHMGVGKSTVARIVANKITQGENKVVTYNLGLDIKMGDLEDQVFKLNPAKPRCFIFEELQGLDKSQQTALLAMLDKRLSNVYVVATTTEIFKLLKTVRSRATIFDFKLLSNLQLEKLLNDYLESKDVKLNKEIKNILVKSCYGVPRDLLKNTDLVLSGEFNEEQIRELLGQVSENLMFSLIASLKSVNIDFVANLDSFLDNTSIDKLFQLREFFTRFILESKGISGGSISKDKLKILNSLFNRDEIDLIGKTLIRAKKDTLALELSLLNMTLTKVSNKQIVGQQIDKLSQNNAVVTVRKDSGLKKDSKLKQSDLKNLKL